MRTYRRRRRGGGKKKQTRQSNRPVKPVSVDDLVDQLERVSLPKPRAVREPLDLSEHHKRHKNKITKSKSKRDRAHKRAYTQFLKKIQETSKDDLADIFSGLGLK